MYKIGSAIVSKLTCILELISTEVDSTNILYNEIVMYRILPTSLHVRGKC